MLFFENILFSCVNLCILCLHTKCYEKKDILCVMCNKELFLSNDIITGGKKAIGPGL
jgi:hypothetical protein